MASPNSVDAALLAVLSADGTLQSTLPDGVYIGAAAPNAERFILVEAIDHEEEPGLMSTLWERYVYYVRAVATSTEGSAVIAGSDRIHALLHRVPLTVDGYSWMSTMRISRNRPNPELDPIDTDMRFQSRGGHYEIFVSPGAPVAPLVPYAEQVIRDGASHYWRLNEPAGTIAVDPIGYAHGTISGGVTLGQPGAVSGDTAMTFDGTTGQIVTAVNVALFTPYTLEWWMRTTSTAQKAFMSNELVPNADGMLTLDIYNSRLHVHYMSTAGLTDMIPASGPLVSADGQWHHVVLVCTGTTMIGYVNSVAYPTHTLNGPIVGIARSFEIGASVRYAQFFPGSLDEVAIYPRALSASEILAHYQAR